MTNQIEQEIISLPIRYNQRLLTEHFGMKKYPKPSLAICELVANSLGADATKIKIDINRNSLDGIESIIISDNGYGISRETIEERFSEVGAIPSSTHKNEFSRFGVGRFSVFRLGSISKWSSVYDTIEGRRRVSFRMDVNEKECKYIIDNVGDEVDSGTIIEITNLYAIQEEQLTKTIIMDELLAQFCSFLLGNRDKEIIVLGETLEISSSIDYHDNDTLLFTHESGINENITIDHLLLKRSIERSRTPEQLLYCSKGRTILSKSIERPISTNYIGIIQCDYLDTIVTENRDALLEMDSIFPSLQALVENSVINFDERYQEERKRKYIERARKESFYPFHDSPKDSITRVQQDMYDVVLEKVNESVNLDGMTAKQRAIIFRLLERVLASNDALDVVSHVIGLKDNDMAAFKKVLEHTRLSSIIHLSSEVTSRLNFLDVLHELVYSPDIAKHLKERSQLHKILESNCWLFGQQYYLASSDKGFRTIIQRHREIAKLSTVDPDAITNISGINDIPDIFLATKKDYIQNPKHNHLLVEIKAPKVYLGAKERDQIRKYAKTIRDSHEFDKTSTYWDLFLVSAKCTDEIEDDRNQKNRQHGCLDEWDEMRVWAFEWSELISNAREEMQLVREHLQRTSEELSVSDYLRENFPDILGKLQIDE